MKKKRTGYWSAQGVMAELGWVTQCLVSSIDVLTRWCLNNSSFKFNINLDIVNFRLHNVVKVYSSTEENKSHRYR